jgi:hypothetical protein
MRRRKWDVNLTTNPHYILETISMTTTGFTSLKALYWPNYTYLKFCKYTVAGFIRGLPSFSYTWSPGLPRVYHTHPPES